MKQENILIFTHTCITKGCATRKAENEQQKESIQWYIIIATITLQLWLLQYFACLLITMVSCRGQKGLISHTQVGLFHLLKSNF